MVSGRRRSTVFFTIFGICVTAITVALNIGWIVLNWRTGVLLFFGVLFFLIVITGVVLNTIFLVREIRRNEQHDAFINAVTHELKTPVASIRLYLETLKTRPIDEAKRTQIYDIMLADSDRLLGTIEQVLRAGRAGGHRQNTRIDLAALARDCVTVAQTRHHLNSEQISYCEVLPGGARAIVMGDDQELSAAIHNLLDNAVKYSGPSVSVTVELTAEAPNRAVLRVRDRGVGIAPAELKRIFKRFYRIPGMRVKGTGLGLYIVRSVAERHGGKAFAESEGTGTGSTFTLQLPLAHQP